MKRTVLVAGFALALLSVSAGAMDIVQFNRLKYRAENGDVGAMLEVGDIYLYGKYRIAQDDGLAYNMFRGAADRGSPQGMFLVGECYFYGKGVNLDVDRAIYWFIEAADHGNGQAAQMLRQIPPQHRQRPDWNNGDPMGGVVRRGPATPPPPPPYYYDGNQGRESRFDILRREAHAGDVESMYALAIMFRDGEDGAPVNEQKAFAWFQRAAKQGLPRAMHELANMYGKGLGTPQDINLARHWDHEARNHGYFNQ